MHYWWSLLVFAVSLGDLDDLVVWTMVCLRGCLRGIWEYEYLLPRKGKRFFKFSCALYLVVKYF